VSFRSFRFCLFNKFFNGFAWGKLKHAGGFSGPWADLDHPLDADVLVCAEERAAAREVIELVDRLPGLRGIDAGGLGSALAIEALTPALLEVNRRYKTHAAIRLTGLDHAD